MCKFLRGLLPYKPQWEIYTLLGLQKHGKNLFYRDFLHHLRHSSDDFIVAPGIRGLVMPVFTLPSYPYVFKVIKDVIAPPKEVTRQQSRTSTGWSSTTTASGAWPTRWNTPTSLFRKRFTPTARRNCARSPPP